MRYKESRIESVSDLIKKLELHVKDKTPIWFRGQSTANWGLTPSIAREKKFAGAEAILIKRFKQNALPHIPTHPQTEWDWLFLMQHYRLPTRLLDWSESPLAALYFAVADKSKKNAALWCLDPIALNSEANITFDHGGEIPAFGYDKVLDSYLPSSIASEHTTDLNPIAAIAQRNSPRIAAQLGTFTITHRTHTSVEDVGTSKHVWMYVISGNKKNKIRKELASLRYTKLTLFPELDSVAETAQEDV